MKTALYRFLFTTLLALVSTVSAQAQTLPCGNIIAPENFNPLMYPLELETTPVEDCGDPFKVTTDPPSPYQLLIEGVVVQEGDIVPVSDGVTGDIVSVGEPVQTGVDTLLFAHDGNDYRYIDFIPPEPTFSDYEAYAADYFSRIEDQQRYLEITEVYLTGESVDNYLYDAEYNLLVDEFTGQYIEDRFYDFIYAFDEDFVPPVAVIGPGTYTMVWREYTLINTYRSIWDTIRDAVIPTAHAQYIGPPPYTYALTFTITEALPEPTGASSILFLPGIQASRLYTDGIFGSDDQLWTPSVPFGNQDVEQLAMDENGNSINDIFTKDILDEVFGLGSVYGNFSDFLEDRKNATVPIRDYTEFAYDWRYDVSDIVANGTKYKDEIKSLVGEFEKLAEDSYTGKVIIIGHSNGGLLGKALIRELERTGKSDNIDKFIMIGTPQLGTPKAVGTILHAYDQELLYGLVVDDYTAREVINNMPGAYGLLPSEKYIQTSSEPVVTFDTSSTTAPYRLAFGGTAISSFDEYSDFLTGVQGPVRSLQDLISTPAPANQEMMENAFENHRNLLDNWQAPSGVEVIEIVGTGLPTPKAIEYREVFEGQTCVNINNQTTCTPKALLKAYAVLTKYGDQTVVQRSAEAYEGNKNRYFVNLRDLNESIVSNESKPYVHFNLSEIPQVQQLIDFIISSTSIDSIPYISTTETEFDDAYDVEIIDSPVRMVAEDEDGNITGVIAENGQMVIKEEIPGSQYFEMGGTKYLVIPKDTKRTTKLYGEETGNYTLTVSSLSGTDTQTIKHKLENATVTPQMIASYSSDGVEFSTVTTDLDGDGRIDIETTIDGEVVRFTYDDLNRAIKDTKLARAPERVLLELVAAAKRAGDKKARYPLLGKVEDVLLDQALSLVKLYKQKKILTQTELTTLNRIIIDIKSQ